MKVSTAQTMIEKPVSQHPGWTSPEKRSLVREERRLALGNRGDRVGRGKLLFIPEMALDHLAGNLVGDCFERRGEKGGHREHLAFALRMPIHIVKGRALHVIHQL